MLLMLRAELDHELRIDENEGDREVVVEVE